MGEYIKADGVIPFSLYLMNKMRRNLIKIRSRVLCLVGLTAVF